MIANMFGWLISCYTKIIKEKLRCLHGCKHLQTFLDGYVHAEREIKKFGWLFSCYTNLKKMKKGNKRIYNYNFNSM